MKSAWVKSLANDEDSDVPEAVYTPEAMAALSQQTDSDLGNIADTIDTGAPREPVPVDPGAPLKHSPFAALAAMAPSPKGDAAEVVDVNATNDRDDVARGRSRDAQARLMRAIELSGKQLNSAIGGVPVAALASPESTNFEAAAQARAEKNEAKRFTRSQAEIAAAHQRAMLERQQRNDALTQEQKRIAAERQAERDKHGDVEKDEDQEIRRQQNKATLALAGASLRENRNEHDYKHNKDDDDNARARIKGVPKGWELDDDVELTDKQKQDFGGLVVSAGKMKGLTKRLRELLSTASIKDKILPTALNNQLGQVATQLVIEGKNVAELGALSGPDMGLMNSIAADPSNVRNILKDAGALSEGLDAWADNSIAANAKIGFHPKAAAKSPTSTSAPVGATGTSGPAAPVTATGKNGEKIQYVNGKWVPLK